MHIVAGHSIPATFSYDGHTVSLAIAYKSVSLKTIYTQFSESALQNFIFAYNSEGVSVPVTREMENIYRIIRALKIHELSISHLRIIAGASPSL